jgi:hypothetical protein
VPSERLTISAGRIEATAGALSSAALTLIFGCRAVGAETYTASNPTFSPPSQVRSYLTSHYSAPRSWLGHARKKLAELGHFPHNWNGYGSEAPNAVSLQQADGVLDVLAELDFSPTNLIASAENGVAFSFRLGERYAMIECFNSGEIAAAISSGLGHADSWDVSPSDLKETIETIYDHVHGRRAG